MIRAVWQRKNPIIGVIAFIALANHLVMRYHLHYPEHLFNIPLFISIALCLPPLVGTSFFQIAKKNFNPDFMAVISIVSAVLLKEYLIGNIAIFLWASEAIFESMAGRMASSSRQALFKRKPSIVHRKDGLATQDVGLGEVQIGDMLVLFPYEVSPVDGEVVNGHGIMDETYLTGGPSRILKTIGSSVYSGAINGESTLTIRATRLASNSRYAKLLGVIQRAAEDRPRLEQWGRIGGMIFMLLSLAIAVGAGVVNHNSLQFLAVLMIATPGPLFNGILMAKTAFLSHCMRSGIVVKKMRILEQMNQCRTIIINKTGTPTYGEIVLTEQICRSPFDARETLQLAASLERYSRHPLAQAILEQAEREQLILMEADRIQELSEEGLSGVVNGLNVRLSNRKYIWARGWSVSLPDATDGMECLVIINDTVAAVYRFRDKILLKNSFFISRLSPQTQFERRIIVSSDREPEVRYLAEDLGISEIHADQSPEQILRIVREETARSKTIFIGDGIHDAPAIAAATIGLVVGNNSDMGDESAGMVVMNNSLLHVDEYVDLNRRMQSIALQSAVGGMMLSAVGMGFAVAGILLPLAGLVIQKGIHVLAILNAMRVSIPPSQNYDLET